MRKAQGQAFAYALVNSSDDLRRASFANSSSKLSSSAGSWPVPQHCRRQRALLVTQGLARLVLANAPVPTSLMLSPAAAAYTRQRPASARAGACCPRSFCRASHSRLCRGDSSTQDPALHSGSSCSTRDSTTYLHLTPRNVCRRRQQLNSSQRRLQMMWWAAAGWYWQASIVARKYGQGTWLYSGVYIQ